MKQLLAVFAFMVLGIAQAHADSLALPPSGEYKLDKTHASVIFRVRHLGLSNYTMRFTKMDATLHLDSGHPSNSSITATIDPASIRTDFPNPEPDFDKELTKEKWLDTARFPLITFKSTKVEHLGIKTARVTGDLTLHGVTLPVTLDTTFNGYMSLNWGKPEDHIGFSAKGTLKRSAFGVTEGIPEPRSNMGVGDDVEVIIEAEFFKPAEQSK